MRRNVAFDKGHGRLGRRIGAGRGADVGEYGPRETSEFSDAYYGPADEYSRRQSGSGGYSREQEPIAPNPQRTARPIGRFAPQRHPDNRTYVTVQSFGELRQGEPSWADLESKRGRGPKGYTRSDERLTEAVCERLTDDEYIDASDITVEVKQGLVTLTGTIPSKNAKWRVEDVVESIAGVAGLNNWLRIGSAG